MSIEAVLEHLHHHYMTDWDTRTKGLYWMFVDDEGRETYRDELDTWVDVISYHSKYHSQSYDICLIPDHDHLDKNKRKK